MSLIKIILVLLLMTQNAGAAVSFGSANTDAATCGTATAVLDNTAAFSYCAWVYLNAVSGTYASNSQQFFQKRKVGTAQINAFPFGTKRIGLYRDTGVFNFNLQSADNSISTGAWNHLCITGDASGTAANHHIYVNGSEVSYATQTNGTGGLIANSTGTVYLGNATGASFSLNGLMQDPTIWSTQITAADVTALYNGGVQGFNNFNVKPANIVLYTHFNECANNVTCSGSNQFTDLTTNANNCTAAGSPKGVASVYTYHKGSVERGSTLY